VNIKKVIIVGNFVDKYDVFDGIVGKNYDYWKTIQQNSNS